MKAQAFLAACSVLLLFGCGKGGGGGVAVPFEECHRASTSDDFMYKPDASSFARSFAVGSDSGLYVAGWANDGHLTHALLRKSVDNGQTWNTIEDYTGPESTGAVNTAVAAGKNGEVYLGMSADTYSKHPTVGIQYSLDNGAHWKYESRPVPDTYEAKVTGAAMDASNQPYFSVSYKSKKGGSQWYVLKGTDLSTLEKFGGDTGYTGAEPSGGIALDGAGDIFVAGVADDKDFMGHWTVRESTDGGKTFKTVDDYIDGPYASIPNSISVGSDGTIYVAGRSVDYSGSRWLIRSSTDGGATWATIDDYRSAEHKDAAARFVVDIHGNPFVVGDGTQPDTGAHWTGRFWNPSGSRWKVLDDFQYSAKQSADAFGAGVAPTGDIFVVGEGLDDSSHTHWIVRQLSLCH